MSVCVLAADSKGVVDIDVGDTFKTFTRKIIEELKLEDKDLVFTRDNDILKTIEDIHTLGDGDTVVVTIKHLEELLYLREHRTDFELESLGTEDFAELHCLLTVGCNPSTMQYSNRKYVNFISRYPHNDFLELDIPGSVPMDLAGNPCMSITDNTLEYFTWTMHITQCFVKSEWFNMNMVETIMNCTRDEPQKWFLLHIIGQLTESCMLHVAAKYPCYLDIVLDNMKTVNVWLFACMCKSNASVQFMLDHEHIKHEFNMKLISRLTYSTISVIVNSNVFRIQELHSDFIHKVISVYSEDMKYTLELVKDFITMDHYTSVMKDAYVLKIVFSVKMPSDEDLKYLLGVAMRLDPRLHNTRSHIIKYIESL